MLNKIQNIFLKKATTEILFDRDSVCMGDDCMSHIKTVQVEQKRFISDLLHQLADYVPAMKGRIHQLALGLRKRNCFVDITIHLSLRG